MHTTTLMPERSLKRRISSYSMSDAVTVPPGEFTISTIAFTLSSCSASESCETVSCTIPGRERRTFPPASREMVPFTGTSSTFFDPVPRSTNSFSGSVPSVNSLMLLVMHPWKKNGRIKSGNRTATFLFIDMMKVNLLFFSVL